MEVREVKKEEAKLLLNMLTQLDKETDMMMFEAGERKSTVEDITQHIKQREKTGSLTLGVFAENVIVGYLVAERGFANRIKHSYYVHLGILESYHGLGLASRMLEYLINYAKSNSIKRIELTVRVDNNKAISLYKKFGFKIEGTKRYSLYINNSYIDEYYMSRII